MQPYPAASVILLREPRPGALEVCMLRRRRGSSFMASAFVFPGGGVDARDDDPQLHTADTMAAHGPGWRKCPVSSAR